jgi:hypothetical protein
MGRTVAMRNIAAKMMIDKIGADMGFLLQQDVKYVTSTGLAS